MAKQVKNVMLVKPNSVGGNFEHAAIPAQGMSFLSAALKKHAAAPGNPFLYDNLIWLESMYSVKEIDPVKDLEGVDLLLATCLINEYPRIAEIIRQARAAHPGLKIGGGGPQMGPLPEDALEDGADVVVQGEGEMVIGTLADILLSGRSPEDISRMLHKVDGIAFLDRSDHNGLVKIPISPARLSTPPDYVRLPDFDAIVGVTSRTPMLAGVLETRRGCTESCEFCEVRQQFKGYRRVSLETELARILQLQQLAADGKIYANAKGDFTVFITDDLHIPPGKAQKFLAERYQRTLQWKGRTEGMHFIVQIRAEAAQYQQMLDAFAEAGGEMMYVGAESLTQANLDSVGKRQEVGQLKRDLSALKKQFSVVAMLIAGLPFDTEQTLMAMAEEAKLYSHYQTDNMVTPLPATPLWNSLQPLDEDGSPLPAGKRRPYHLYTGRQFVHVDTVPGRNWSMQESARIETELRSRLKHVDTLYKAMFSYMRRQLAKR